MVLSQAFTPILTAEPDLATFAGTIQSQNLDFKQGRVQQFNLNVEHQVAGRLVVLPPAMLARAAITF